MTDENIFQLHQFQLEILGDGKNTKNDLCERYNGKKTKTNDEAYLNNKNTNVNKKSSLNSRLSRELQTIVDGQIFLCEQYERECLVQKRIQSINDDSEPLIKRLKPSSSSTIEEVIERINNKLNDMNKNIDIIMDIRNSFFV